MICHVNKELSFGAASFRESRRPYPLRREKGGGTVKYTCRSRMLKTLGRTKVTTLVTNKGLASSVNVTSHVTAS